jgi:pyruvate/2-oxoacid:ferredoxin oxidoreductase beta subunit
VAKLTVPVAELMDPGHVACQGCGAALAMRLFLKAAGPDTALVIPACCWAVIAGPMPYTCLGVPTVFSAFEATAAVASGLKAGLRRTGRGDTLVAGFAGDGGTADIGLQALSGAAERNEDIIYVCYDNEAYMNTGIQRSGSTPPGVWTTTTPGGLAKTTSKKDMPGIMAAHEVPYVATLNPSFPEDFVAKVQKATKEKGLRYLHILADCPTGWKHDPSLMVRVGRLATQTNLWPLYEVEHGAWRITWEPGRPAPVEDYLKLQGRFQQMGPQDVARVQREVDERWRALKGRAQPPSPPRAVAVATLPVGDRPDTRPTAANAPVPSPVPSASPARPMATASAPAPLATPGTGLPRCYMSDKPCDGSCGHLLPSGACLDLLLASGRHK